MTRCLAAVLLVAAVLTGLTGCGGGPSATTPAKKSSPPITAQPTPTRTPAPVRGQCYALTFEDAAAATTAEQSVPCTAAHTSVTAFVGKLDLISDGHLLSVDSDAAQQQVSTVCPQKVAEWLGGTPDDLAMSRFRPVWFTPTLQQAEAGSRWFRCDVVALTDQPTLLNLPKVKGALADPGLATWGTCANQSPASPDLNRIRCAQPHSWRVVSTVHFPSDANYQGPNAKKAADADCSTQAAKNVGGALSYKYSVEWPSQKVWDTGVRIGLCWAQTKS